MGFLKIYIIALLFFILSFPFTGFADPDKSKAQDIELKSAFIYNFTKFVEWPDTVFTNKNSPLRICILDDKPIIDVFKTISKKTFKGRKIEVVPYMIQDDIESCHILYISENNNRLRVAKILESLSNQPVLTIGESEGFIKLGGVIRFYSANKRLTFEINPDTAKSAKLVISSKLLGLAKIIRSEP